jgi:ABC-type hemin transport system ATPase subunit
LEVAQHTCDCFVVLSEGKVVISGRASDVLSDDEFTLEEVFLRMTHLNDRICEKRVVLNGLSFVTN